MDNVDQRSNKSFGEILRQIHDSGKQLFLSELKLIKVELSYALQRLGRYSIWFIVGAWLFMFSLAPLLASIILYFGERLGGKYWQVSISAAGVLAVFGLGLLIISARRIQKGAAEMRVSSLQLEKISDTIEENLDDLSLAARGGTI